MTRRIIVTGGGTGIGLAIARRFLVEHPELILIGRREQPLTEAAAALREADQASTVTTHPCDLTDPDAVADLATRISDGGAVDVLVANAGGNLGLGSGDLHQLADSWRADFDGNVLPTVLLTEALLDAFSRPGGRIVAMSSVAALRGSSSYGAAKAAVNAWVLWMAVRLAEDGVTVNAVAPGFVPDTDFWRPRIEADPGIVANRVAPIPMGRPGTPEEVAEAVAYLSAPDAGWTTGQILQVNGGTLLGRG
ncbi:SDR family NAD(P)-dependent oxidoreductase [Allobranchiibius sp. GilTou73]|uniref:SDR family NAD(P)-dependent oxidoreductase n=1 Tax=Allobranchiibius sp. GilTou73 TaxID=2904523 RepID=UPI001F3AB9BA|nr:SDR family oxidoreductase [Allobranchiibius sp. GilTou73]UIJ33841.1 SDR family oxidoreductase [Allobranchiibius sp. GilTou73]